MTIRHLEVDPNKQDVISIRAIQQLAEIPNKKHKKTLLNNKGFIHETF